MDVSKGVVEGLLGVVRLSLRSGLGGLGRCRSHVGGERMGRDGVSTEQDKKESWGMLGGMELWPRSWDAARNW